MVIIVGGMIWIYRNLKTQLKSLMLMAAATLRGFVLSVARMIALLDVQGFIVPPDALVPPVHEAVQVAVVLLSA